VLETVDPIRVLDAIDASGRETSTMKKRACVIIALVLSCSFLAAQDLGTVKLKIFFPKDPQLSFLVHQCTKFADPDKESGEVRTKVRCLVLFQNEGEPITAVGWRFEFFDTAGKRVAGDLYATHDYTRKEAAPVEKAGLFSRDYTVWIPDAASYQAGHWHVLFI